MTMFTESEPPFLFFFFFFRCAEEAAGTFAEATSAWPADGVASARAEEALVAEL